MSPSTLLKDYEFDEMTGNLQDCCYCRSGISQDEFINDIYPEHKKKYLGLSTLREIVFGSEHSSITDISRHPHQWRITPSTLDNAWHILTKDGFLSNGHSNINFSDFEELYDRVWYLLKEKGNLSLGRLSIYDISLRIGFNFKQSLEPEVYVYLHRGAMDGAKKLFPGKKFRFREPLWIFTSLLPDMNAASIEDYLCCVISRRK